MKQLYVLFALFIFSFVNAQNPADRDPSFNQVNAPYNNFYIEKNIENVKRYPDGKLLVLNADNKLNRIQGNLFDNTFFTGSGFNDLINDYEIQVDGKIIVVGNFTTFNGQNVDNVIRLNVDGSIDTSFNLGGTGYSGQGIKSVDIQSNGKIILLKDVSSALYNGVVTGAIFRLNTNGSIDNTFTTSFTASEYISSSSILQNDKLLVRIIVDMDVTIKLLNINGSIDVNFSSITVSNPGLLYDVKLLNDGKILIAGNFTTLNGVAKNGIAKINPDGTIDNSFIASAARNGGGSRVSSIAVQSDNKIVLCGNFNFYNLVSKNGIVRINSDGSIDNTFSLGSGFTYITEYNYFTFILNNDKMDILGSFNFYNGNVVDGYMRLNNDGTIDTSINNTTKGLNGGVSQIALQSDGKILLYGGFCSYNGAKRYQLLRLNTNGELDSTFDFGGEIGLENFINNSNIYSIASDFNNKIILAGSTIFFNNQQINQIIKLNANGSKDNNFSTGTGFGMASIYKIATQTDNKILVYGGFTTYQGQSVSEKNFMRLTAGGGNDVTFNNNLNNAIPFGEAVVGFELLSTGKILVLSDLNNNNRLRRINSDGTIDNTFNLIQFSGERLYLKSFLDGSFFVGKTVNNHEVLEKYNSSGVLDTSFSMLPLSVAFSFITDYAIQLDGKVILSMLLNGSQHIFKRLNSNGSDDTSFMFSSTDSTNTNSLKVKLQNDGKIILSGYFKKYNGIAAVGIVRLLGEEYNIFQGKSKLDYNLNGCDVNDNNFSNLKLVVNSPSYNFDYYANSVADFKFGIINGITTVTPVLENSTYFNVSPTSVIVNFPTQISPFSQNFCISPNGVHPDLEVYLFPLNVARPGFDAKYKLVYKNKGNQIQSGTVAIAFNDAVLDLVSANPVVSVQVLNNLSWNFTNLNPFETREIVFTLSVNSPTETPPVNGGTVLSYSGTVSSSQTDETPNDNTFVFNQTVVNSFDPNDKTCLEGATISQAKVGDYVHYMIRFENTGTYPAQNITVKDLIDTSKFDINTLVPINGSHLFTTKISEGNKVEFVFEGINLPFDDGNNDGYVAFKIKTKSTLVNGDSFSNSAGIYFDYNSAITTNTYTTTIQTLSLHDFAFGNYFVLYPNPVNDILNISKKEAIEVSSIDIYNTLGQLILVIPNAQNTSTVDVSNLASGNYFVKINSDKGTSNTKFIKR
ncbi:MAG: T9SS type A sorting domain-containing protein [Flavobacterium sp.]